MIDLGNKVLAKCNAALDALEVFYKARWSQVKEGNTVLVSEHGYIHEARVVDVCKCSLEGRDCIKVTLKPGSSERRYISVCWPATTVYIKSRF